MRNMDRCASNIRVGGHSPNLKAPSEFLINSSKRDSFQYIYSEKLLN
jgi:hypothetical protein